MRSVARTAAAVSLGSLALLLAGCSSDGTGGISGSREALDALKSLGITCEAPLITESTGVPFTRIACPGLQIEWVDDVDEYNALWRSDCAAVPADRRDAMSDIVFVTGDRWLIRGNGIDDVDAWPLAMPPEQAAARLDGTLITAADYCRSTGAWAS